MPWRSYHITTGYAAARMQIPEYWAEARLTGKVNGRERAVRRFGWSDESLAHAETQAQARARAAMVELQAGRNVPQREQKLPYGGNGLPIREQVVARHGDLVITRNSYGARCLNEPDVLFADVDVQPRLPALVERAASRLAGVLPMTAFLMAIWLWRHDGTASCCLALVVAVALPIGILGLRAHLRARPRTLAASRARTEQHVRQVLAQHAHGRFALYETPAGLRVLALHDTFDPCGEATRTLLRELETDAAYLQMCQLQACFRARVSGKPWRMGIAAHMKPRPGVWPVQEARRAERDAWIARYEEVACGFAACRFVAELGDGPAQARCVAVQRIHDDLSRAHSDLPLA